MATARKHVGTIEGLHIEAKHCIVNIYEGLQDTLDRSITTIEIIPDNYYGEPEKRIIGSRHIRIVELKKKEKRQ